MTAFTISQHAAERWCERINPRATPEQAHAEIGQHARAIEAAVQFGCSYVKLGKHARLVLRGSVIVTVYGFGQRPRSMRWDEIVAGHD